MEAQQKKPSGLLNGKRQTDKFTLRLLSPSPDLELYVEHYWIVKWDLRGQEPYVSENVPHPSVHLTVEPDRTVITGVVKQKFTRTLTGRGVVFGIKFYPGAFYPFAQEAVSRFTGRIEPAEHVFGSDAAALADEIRSLAAEDEAGMAARAECFLRKRLPERDHNVELIRAVIERIRNDRGIISVETAAAEFHLTVRMLQRLFSKYVGASPKWAIRRYRLLEVADQLAEGPPASWPQLAAELGTSTRAILSKISKASSACRRTTTLGATVAMPPHRFLRPLPPGNYDPVTAAYSLFKYKAPFRLRSNLRG